MSCGCLRNFHREASAVVVVPVAATVGIAFAVLQWVLISKVKVTPVPRAEGGEASTAGGKDGSSEYLIKEEEGFNDHNVVVKCAEIQTAISEGDATAKMHAIKDAYLSNQ
ncbi:hypothetical protein ZWY2020_048864 [Hordeum vulgare]|nr:hypothetical protein ZWY2020_048864 [Hordeum vulgare]